MIIGFKDLIGTGIYESSAPKDIEPLIGEAVHCVVHIAKINQRRKVQDILEVNGYQDGRYITHSI